MNYLERLEVGYSKEEALYMDELIIRNRADELHYKLCCEGGLTDDEMKELEELETFIDTHCQLTA